MTLPSELTEPLSWIGLTWPEADEDKLQAAGEAWLDLADQLRTVKSDADSAVRPVRDTTKGPAADAFDAWWSGDQGPERTLDDDADAAEIIGGCLLAFAAITITAKLAFIAQLTALAIQIAALVASAFFTFGASMAASPGIVALTRVACREVIERVLSRLQFELAKLFRSAAEKLRKVGAKKAAAAADRTAGKLAAKSSDNLVSFLRSATGRRSVDSPHDGAIFYSGGYKNADGEWVSMRSVAESHHVPGQTTTLENTPGGKYLDDWKLYGDDMAGRTTPAQRDELWGDVSSRYADNSSGNVTAYVHRDNTEGVYYNRELPRLGENPNVTGVDQVDPVSGTTTHPLSR